MNDDWKNDPEQQAAIRAQWGNIKVGDRLTYRTPHGGKISGKVVFKFDTHCTLNCGGKHGTPGICTPENFHAHYVQRKKVTA